ncbi:STAS domain-containing protein [Candidatus Magnetaquicoccus inordinatus]|uniref:STAS domain-containing protein n=1 Tax=Candidatus Magnetaquicoccus inordinatus TaxID=2496818 RepID=UPI00102B0DD5|nr:STAS domain-containing protein [Candidatus Magnetaquicoccus inordinatus]
MIDFSVDDTGSTGTLILSGPLTIQHALSLKETLLKVGGDVKHLILNLDQVSSLDLTALQMLCAAHREWVKKGKKLTREGNVPDIVNRVVRESGFTGCLENDDVIGLWTGASN